MKGYLTTCDGAQFELPTLLKWEFSYTGSVPCDSFTLKCAYEPAMAEVLRRAVRFTAREDGTVEFAGVVDECGVTCDEKGLQLEVSGRGMAALLLDNEAESVSYQWATMEEILKNHVTPYGIVCTGYDAVTAAARYRVANRFEPVEGAERFCSAARRDRAVFRQDGRAGGEEKPQGRAREH